MSCLTLMEIILYPTAPGKALNYKKISITQLLLDNSVIDRTVCLIFLIAKIVIGLKEGPISKCCPDKKVDFH